MIRIKNQHQGKPKTSQKLESFSTTRFLDEKLISKVKNKKEKKWKTKRNMQRIRIFKKEKWKGKGRAKKGKWNEKQKSLMQKWEDYFRSTDIEVWIKNKNG